MARISVLLPVYNVEAFVAEALVSIQSQTFADIEIVVVDDGSTDNTLQIVEQIASSDPRIRIVRTPRNLGLCAALNFGLPFCRSPFIARMDGDDIALPTRLQKQFEFLEQNPDIALVGCATIAIDEAGVRIPKLSASRKPENQDEVARTMLLASPCSHIWLARREVYDVLGGYRPFECAEDYDFILRAITAGFRVSNLPEALMLIRKHSQNLSSRLEQQKSHYYVAHLCRERMKGHPDTFSEDQYKRILSWGPIEHSAYLLAVTFVRMGLQTRYRILRGLLFMLSAFVSPWQARYFLTRFRLKRALHRREFTSSRGDA
jgi:glycosyltransferase involved in cell wall biosynthesis